MGFDALDYEAGVLRDQAASMKEYAVLKTLLLRRTQRAGAALAAYLLLTVSGEVLNCTLLEIRDRLLQRVQHKQLCMFMAFQSLLICSVSLALQRSLEQTDRARLARKRGAILVS